MYSPEGKSVTLGSSGAGLIQIGHIGKSNSQGNRVYSPEGKSVTLSANSGGLGPNTGLYKINEIRRLTPIECERLQGLPDNYTEGISNTQRYKCLGNAFNVDVIKFILSYTSLQ
jgi:DNA (cytosine-5)-methyltransferase 3A